MNNLNRRDNPRRFEGAMHDGVDRLIVTAYPAVRQYNTSAQVRVISLGPRGGEYPFANFSGEPIGAKRLDLLIDLLTEARERAFGPR